MCVYMIFQMMRYIHNEVRVPFKYHGMKPLRFTFEGGGSGRDAGEMPSKMRKRCQAMSSRRKGPTITRKLKSSTFAQRCTRIARRDVSLAGKLTSSYKHARVNMQIQSASHDTSSIIFA